MAWRIEISQTAERAITALDKSVQRRILRFLNERVAPAEDPKVLAKSLMGPFGGLWRFRVGDYRLICDIQGERLTVLVLDVAHRREVYR